MIVRNAPVVRGLSAYYTDSETGAPLFNDRGELADENDMYRFLGRPDVVRELDRLIFEMCAEYRRKGEKLHAWMLQAELEVFQRTRIREPA